MDTKFTAILNSLSSKEPRSCLEPYSELIIEMRKRGRTYREIADVLKQTCGLTVGKSTVHDFVLAHSKSKIKSPACQAVRNLETNRNRRALRGLRSTYKDAEARKSTISHPKTLESIVRTIKDLKDQPLKTPAKKLLFEYNAEEPLRLQHSHKK
jgi:hypothetical protein